MVKKRIVVIEDDQDSRDSLCIMLEGLGYEYLAYPSGKTALAAIKSENVDLILLDIMMPEMNGYEVLQAIRNISDCAKIPVIMVTAKDVDQEIIEGYKFGADYYITKPFTSKQLEYGLKLYLEPHTDDH